MESTKNPEQVSPRRALGWFLALAGLLVAAGFVVLGARPEVASAHGVIVDRVLTFLTIVTGVFLVVGHVLLGRWILGSHANPATFAKPPSRRAEVRTAWIVVLVMALISESGVIALGLPAWEQLYGKAPEDALVVEVVGKQFGWIVRYPGKDGRFGRTRPELVNDASNPLGIDEDDPDGEDDIVLDGLMHLPVDRPVLVRLRSHDVIHSFNLPHLRVKQDVVPGMISKVQFRPTRIGRFEIACAQLCGLGHYRMRGILHVDPAADFESWLGKQDTFK